MTNTKDLILKLRAVYQEKKGTGEKEPGGTGQAAGRMEERALVSTECSSQIC